MPKTVIDMPSEITGVNSVFPLKYIKQTTCSANNFVHFLILQYTLEKNSKLKIIIIYLLKCLFMDNKNTFSYFISLPYSMCRLHGFCFKHYEFVTASKLEQPSHLKTWVNTSQLYPDECLNSW